ncbi:preprotein translocase subunit SecG [Methylomonas rapida]|uniref:Protein-export membrane protein SecG n=1 Tax=Methylomonas rapida TaxID=2963939 RepID=A0ABY7GMZ3_9GAMM|nr:preprotein translocase subunit SecG [Methylomonas rapida]WAR45878.1 preprotein translocase subunit SecG [Methylomonas rapida]
MLYQIIIVIHILLGIGIIGLILMQQGKGADAGAAFGSGASGSVFGAQGSASFLSRSTAIFATLFFITSLGLAFLSGYQGKKTDIILDTPAAEPKVSDVPLSQKAGDDSVPVVKLPEAPAIKEVEPSVPAKAQ